jgi:hypothetical protein
MVFFSLTVKQPWDIDDTEVMMLRPRQFDFQDIVGKSLLEVFKIFGARPRYAHALCSLKFLSAEPPHCPLKLTSSKTF